jgi:hypothetical protein
VRLLSALLVIAALAGCGPVQSTASLIDAEVALEAARTAGAPQSAAYEYVIAESYLKKAKETANRARYESANQFAHKAKELANEARTKAIAASNRGETP